MADPTSSTELYERGLAISNLTLVSDVVKPLFGRVIELRTAANNHDNAQRSISAKFRQGSPLMLYRGGAQLEPVAECVMLRSAQREIQLKLNKKLDQNLTVDCHNQNNQTTTAEQGTEISTTATTYTLIPSVTTGVLHSLTKFISDSASWRGAPGERILHYTYRALPMSSVHHDRKLHYILDELNDDQKRAVSAALNKNRPVVTIQGPPGTGKTAVLIEIILQAIRAKQKVLCAPSNLAIENIITRIRNYNEQCRIGMDPNILMEDELKEDHNNYKQLVEIYERLVSEHLNESIRLNGYSSAITKKLMQDGKRLKDFMQKNVISEKQVIFCTVSSSSLHSLKRFGFMADLLIIDEAGQVMECATWLPILQSKRCVLCGDQHQLPAVLQSTTAVAQGLSRSLMEILNQQFGSILNHILSIQYRMNEKIMKWSNEYFYESKLNAHQSVANITLSEISDINEKSVINAPLLMVDTQQKINKEADEFLPEDQSSKSSTNKIRNRPKKLFFQEQSYQHSYRNINEAKLLCVYVNYLLKMRVQSDHIGVISPYFAQVELIRKMLGNSEISVSTVDGFQGQQREVIIMSLVRSNYKGRIGFLSDERRMNVAITRARRQFVLVGNGRMMQNAKHLRTLFDCIQKNGTRINAEKFTSLLRNAQEEKKADGEQ
ncbi:unnamed protein product [Anisakis simplex]|uniref:Helicase ATP-binding domain-containing protein n=1 Tax=Anisakis simplex TaxID=6269 RepID=A0A3P6Q327_ANISI|nr:unnamed protein product [Anisakis simplex]